MDYPDKLKYTREHEWVAVDGDVATVGITHHAQDALGDVVFVELPAVGTRVEQGRQFGTVESVKAVSELFAPLSGEVVETNALLHDKPETVNAEPHGSGWMIKVKLANPAELTSLMTAAQYAELTAA
jgi:glycine cleavage system H protein